MAFYVDTSALVKLVITERETDALRAWFAETDGVFVSSDLIRTELIRATRRVALDRVAHARSVVESVTLLRMRSALFDAAARLEPAELRSLDALHLATALDLGDDLQALVTYDVRLAEAAGAYGVTVVAPAAS